MEQDTPTKDDSLPGLLPDNTIKVPSIEVKKDSTLETVKEADLQEVNNVLSAYHCLWGRVTSITQATRLGQATLQAIKSRRELLCMQYGSPTARNSNEIIPID